MVFLPLMRSTHSAGSKLICSTYKHTKQIFSTCIVHNNSKFNGLRTSICSVMRIRWLLVEPVAPSFTTCKARSRQKEKAISTHIHIEWSWQNVGKEVHSC